MLLFEHLHFLFSIVSFFHRAFRLPPQNLFRTGPLIDRNSNRYTAVSDVPADRLQFSQDLFLIPRKTDRRIAFDQALIVKVQNALIHRNHALIGARCDGIVDLVDLSIANQALHRFVHMHDFKRRHQSAVLFGQELL